MKLQAETTKLVDQMSQCEDRAQTEHGARQQAEERITELENELTSIRIERANLRQEKTYLFSVNERLTKQMIQRDREVKKALSALLGIENGSRGLELHPGSCNDQSGL